MLAGLLSKYTQYVPHIHISGQITHQTSSAVLKHLSKLHRYKPKLLTVSIDSIYGSSVQSEIISKALQQKALELNCPLYTFVEGWALGGAYLILSSGSKVFANPHSLVGGLSASISSIGLVQALKQLKIKSTTISTMNARINPFEVMTPEDNKWIMEILAHHDSSLKKSVGLFREKALSNPAVGKGELFSGIKAKEIGLVDSLNDFHSVLAEEVPKCKVVEFKARPVKGPWGQTFTEELQDLPIALLNLIESNIEDDQGIQLRLSKGA